MMMSLLKVAIISRSANQWPLFIGVKEGFFAKEGLDIEIVVTGSSQKHLDDLSKGMYDIGHQAADHIIRAVDKGSDLFMFMGISTPNQSLIVNPNIEKYEDLRGRRLGVDGTASGYALLLKELLKINGLLKTDYTFVPIGGTGERYNAIVNGEVDGVFIDGPVDLKAEEQGFRRLGSNHDVGIAYQGTVAATKKEWAIMNKSILIRYIKAYMSASDWLYDQVNKKGAVEILKQFVEVPDHLALKTYDRYTELNIFSPNINLQGLSQVLRIMKPDQAEDLEGSLGAYFNLSYYQEVKDVHGIYEE